MLLNRPHPGPGIQAESFSGFRTKSAIVSPSLGNFPMRNTYISAVSYSTAKSFRFLSPLSSEISNQLVDSNTLASAVDAIFIWAPVHRTVARNLGTNVCRRRKKGTVPTNPYKVSSQKEKSTDTCFIDIKTKGNKAEKRYTWEQRLQSLQKKPSRWWTCKLFCVTNVTF